MKHVKPVEEHDMDAPYFACPRCRQISAEISLLLRTEQKTEKPGVFSDASAIALLTMIGMLLWWGVYVAASKILAWLN